MYICDWCIVDNLCKIKKINASFGKGPLFYEGGILIGCGKKRQKEILTKLSKGYEKKIKDLKCEA